MRQEDGSFKLYSVAGDLSFAYEEYGLEEIPFNIGERVSQDEMKTIQALIPDTDFEFPYNNEQLVACYPDADEVTYIDEVVDVSNEKLNQILSENYICSIDEISVLIKALSGLKHERFFELADFFLKKCSYISAFRFHDTDTIITIVERLMKLPRSAEMEDYLLDIMMEYEDEYPAVREKILGYF